MVHWEQLDAVSGVGKTFKRANASLSLLQIASCLLRFVFYWVNLGFAAREATAVAISNTLALVSGVAAPTLVARKITTRTISHEECGQPAT